MAVHLLLSVRLLNPSSSKLRDWHALKSNLELHQEMTKEFINLEFILLCANVQQNRIDIFGKAFVEKIMKLFRTRFPISTDILDSVY